jgi:hypothetical protein
MATRQKPRRSPSDGTLEPLGEPIYEHAGAIMNPHVDRVCDASVIGAVQNEKQLGEPSRSARSRAVNDFNQAFVLKLIIVDAVD